MNTIKSKTMKIILLMMFLLLSISTSVNAAPKLSKKSVTIKVGQKYTLKVTGTKKKITWKSSNKSVAKVKNGVVTGVKAGKCTISAKVDGKTVKCIVTVKKKTTSNTLSKKEQHKLYESTIISYKKRMKSGAVKWSEESGLETYFAFVDIDKNGIDELIVRADHSYKYTHTTASSSGYGEITNIYTIIDKKVKKVVGSDVYAPTFGHSNYIRVYKNCRYIDRGLSHGYFDCQLYSYSNGTISKNKVKWFTKDGTHCSIDGKVVSNDYYTKQLGKYVPSFEGYTMHKYSSSTYKNYI